MTIKLAGENITDVIGHLSLNLNMDKHSQFTLQFANEDSSRIFRGTLADSSKKWIGKPLEVEGFFKGIVTTVSLSRAQGGSSDFVIRGQSPTILMDDGINTQSFKDQPLQQIIDAVLKTYNGKLGDLDINPTYKTPLKYIVQYRESNFDFINRLAARYGQWFYYDGQKLILGNAPKSKPIFLKFGMDLSHFDISMKALPLNFKVLGYDYKDHKTIKGEPDYKPLDHEYADIALNKSKGEVFPQKPVVPINMSMSQEDLKQISKLRQNVHLDELVVLSGASSNQTLCVGSTIEIIDERDGLIAGGVDKYGKYIITHLTHEFGTRAESYSNHFEAIPAGAEMPPLSISPDPPTCEMQEAKVKENNDPDGMGRVKVQFIWQEEKNDMTNWIRVAAPQGGGDKGFYILPEKGDQVLVAFEHNHPERPYVLTGMYHGKSKPEHHDPENLKKAIKTKGGHQILMNDEKGKESMALSSPFDFSAAATAGDMNLKAKSKITIKSDSGDITITTPTNISVDAKGNITIEAKGDITIEAVNINLKGKAAINLEAPTINIKADAELNASAPQVTIDGKMMTTVKGGAMLNVESMGITSVSGTMLKLN